MRAPRSLETVVKRVGLLLVLLATTASADDGRFLLNLDLNMKLPDGSDTYSIKLQGIQLELDVAFHGEGPGQYDYFLTLSNVKDGAGKLTIEFYEYETRKKESEVISEIVSDVDFLLASPTVFEAMGDTFGVDLAFSVVSK